MSVYSAPSALGVGILCAKSSVMELHHHRPILVNSAPATAPTQEVINGYKIDEKLQSQLQGIFQFDPDFGCLVLENGVARQQYARDTDGSFLHEAAQAFVLGFGERSWEGHFFTRKIVDIQGRVLPWFALKEGIVSFFPDGNNQNNSTRSNRNSSRSEFVNAEGGENLKNSVCWMSGTFDENSGRPLHVKACRWPVKLKERRGESSSSGYIMSSFLFDGNIEGQTACRIVSSENSNNTRKEVRVEIFRVLEEAFDGTTFMVFELEQSVVLLNKESVLRVDRNFLLFAPRNDAIAQLVALYDEDLLNFATSQPIRADQLQCVSQLQSLPKVCYNTRLDSLTRSLMLNRMMARLPLHIATYFNQRMGLELPRSVASYENWLLLARVAHRKLSKHTKYVCDARRMCLIKAAQTGKSSIRDSSLPSGQTSSTYEHEARKWLAIAEWQLEYREGSSTGKVLSWSKRAFKLSPEKKRLMDYDFDISVATCLQNSLNFAIQRGDSRTTSCAACSSEEDENAEILCAIAHAMIRHNKLEKATSLLQLLHPNMEGKLLCASDVLRLCLKSTNSNGSKGVSRIHIYTKLLEEKDCSEEEFLAGLAIALEAETRNKEIFEFFDAVINSQFSVSRSKIGEQHVKSDLVALFIARMIFYQSMVSSFVSRRVESLPTTLPSRMFQKVTYKGKNRTFANDCEEAVCALWEQPKGFYQQVKNQGRPYALEQLIKRTNFGDSPPNENVSSNSSERLYFSSLYTKLWVLSMFPEQTHVVPPRLWFDIGFTLRLMNGVKIPLIPNSEKIVPDLGASPPLPPAVVTFYTAIDCFKQYAVSRSKADVESSTDFMDIYNLFWLAVALRDELQQQQPVLYTFPDDGSTIELSPEICLDEIFQRSRLSGGILHHSFPSYWFSGALWQEEDVQFVHFLLSVFFPRHALMKDVCRLDAWKIGKRIGKGAFGAVYETCRSLNGAKKKADSSTDSDSDDTEKFVVKVIELTRDSDQDSTSSGNCAVVESYVTPAGRVVHGETTYPSEVSAWEKLAGLTANERRFLVIPFLILRGESQIGVVLRRFSRGSLHKIRYTDNNNQQPCNLNPESKKWLVCILKGMEALHELGVCHCDIKLANVLCNSYGEAHLTDFGCSTPIGGFVRGTTRTYAPLDETRATPGWDIYSFGCLLAELFGSPYAPREMAQAQGGGGHNHHHHDTRRTPPMINWTGMNISALPQEIQDLCRMCWKYPAASRPSATELLRADVLRDVSVESAARRELSTDSSSSCSWLESSTSGSESSLSSA